MLALRLRLSLHLYRLLSIGTLFQHTRLDGGARCSFARALTFAARFITRRGRRSNCRWRSLRRRSLLVACCLISLAAGAARAADPGATDSAHALYQRGAEHFSVGEFTAALRDFRQAYQLSPRPAFLFNIAACEERLGRGNAAITSLRRYLSAVPDDPDRDAIEARIRALDNPTPAHRLLLDVEPAPPRSLLPSWALWGVAGVAATAGTITAGIAVESPRTSRAEGIASAGLWTVAATAAIAGGVMYAIAHREVRPTPIATARR